VIAQPLLLVEDNEDDIELALHAISRAEIGGGVIVVRDGESALDYLFRRGRYFERDPRELPAVVWLDLQLPDIQGLDILRQLRAHDETRRIPVVVLTTSNEPSDINTSYDLGVNSYICKPLDLDGFVSLVNQMGEYWLNTNISPSA
jgi:two-component system, response regulator